MSNIIEKVFETNGYQFGVFSENKEVARAYLYLIHNHHKEPYGLLEGLWVNEKARGQGIAKKLVEMAIEKAKETGCYKIIGTSRTSRPLVHKMYEDFGFENHGYEFRMDL